MTHSYMAGSTYLVLVLVLPNFFFVHPHDMLALAAHPFVLGDAALRDSPLLGLINIFHPGDFVLDAHHF